MNITLLIFILFGHFFADFLLQTRKMGKEKSEKLGVLFAHIAIQFFVIWGIVFYITKDLNTAHIISGLNALIHGIIDWYIWKAYKLTVFFWMKHNPEHQVTLKYKQTGIYEYWNDHLFYTTIGLDQLFHYSTLILLVYWFN